MLVDDVCLLDADWLTINGWRSLVDSHWLTLAPPMVVDSVFLLGAD